MQLTDCINEICTWWYQNKRFFCENLKGAISNKYLPISKQPFLKHDLEIQIIDYVYTDGASAMLGNI